MVRQFALDRRLLVTLAGWVVLGTYLASLVLMIGFVARFASRVPFLDEYSNLRPLFSEPTLADYWRPQNEHRIPVPRLVYVVALKLTGYDFRAPLAVNVTLLAGVTAVLLASVRRLRGRFALTDAVLPLL